MVEPYHAVMQRSPIRCMSFTHLIHLHLVDLDAMPSTRLDRIRVMSAIRANKLGGTDDESNLSRHHGGALCDATGWRVLCPSINSKSVNRCNLRPDPLAGAPPPGSIRLRSSCRRKATS